MLKGFEEHIILFVLPLTLANLLHMLVVKLDLFSLLAKPVSMRLFGAGKTYRGFVLLPFFTALLCGVGGYLFYAELTVTTFMLGALLGLVYAIGELPNSFVKRQLKIKSGAHGAYRWLQLFF